MDTSETYILMCKQATEIQLDWEPAEGDFVDGDYPSVIREWSIVQNQGSASLRPLFTTKGKLAWYRREEMVWLPRQDQLQDMVNYYSMVRVAHIIVEVDHMNSPYYSKFDSLEKLWLAFVMKEGYDKEWDGKTWV